MTTKGTLATSVYTKASINSARMHQGFVVGFVANLALTDIDSTSTFTKAEDFVALILVSIVLGKATFSVNSIEHPRKPLVGAQTSLSLAGVSTRRKIRCNSQVVSQGGMEGLVGEGWWTFGTLKCPSANETFLCQFYDVLH